jgi:membrane associated rhomboid family serine protease
MQPVVKNLLIINVIFFIATFVFERQGIDLGRILGLFYIDSPYFRPYQLATHFFMHGGFIHLLFNMFGLVVFGNLLEKLWGAKRFLFFYFITALGAAFLHQLIQGIQIYNATGSFMPGLDQFMSLRGEHIRYDMNYAYAVDSFKLMLYPTVGASGAVYGLIAGVAMLFPNNEVYLYGAIPVKMKWLALGLGAIALLAGMANSEGDNTAHFAHLGGMLFGFIIVKIWNKNRSNFY